MATTRDQTDDTPTDALTLLIADHEEVKDLFDQYDELMENEAGSEERGELAEQICAALTLHSALEEELVYPAARQALEEQDLLDEAVVEHASARELIEQIQGMDPDDDLYDAKVTVLGEYVKHHVQEEEDEMFPRLEQSGVDLEALGEEITARKESLMAEVGEEE